MSKGVARSGPRSKVGSRASIPGENTAEVADQRRRMTAEAAYFLAETRAFACRCAVHDWLAAEKQIDVLLANDLKSAEIRQDRSGLIRPSAAGGK